MNPRALETLIAVVEAGGFQAAADRLNLTQSAVSMQMKALETELGIALFDRGRRPPLPTVAGRAAAARARAVLQAIDRVRAVARDPHALAGTLAIGAIPTATTGFLPDALAALGRAHPDLRARVESGLSDRLAARVASGELDAAILTAGSDPPTGIRLHPLYEEPLLVAAREVPGDGQAMTALSSRPFIRFNRATGVGRIIDRRLRADGIAVEDAMELDSIEAILMMASRGLGVAILPGRSLRGPFAEALWTASLPGPPLTRRVALALRDGGLEEPALAALYAALLETVPD
ncbi:LysR family transcriptional regulator [Marivibrio halodurans]|uniref:LysR family transcriptional regulator n=1 Tax=Marivibrio halodurans TaxID=2039722 RepID=A0A8J7S328_9PROT|nr:LysR substrate-binding domain-containing protein [Marivibrio halodurans]MBP5857789.1 LysR family transcriptional regulator [Marivibrio halodurans]